MAAKSAKEVYLNVSGGWSSQLIEDLAHLRPVSDSSLVGKVPTVAFFHLLIEEINANPGLTFSASLPHIISQLGLPVPDSLSNFIRFIQRCVVRSEKKGTCEDITKVPGCFTSKTADMSPILKSVGVTTDWLLNSTDVLPQPFCLTYGMVLELAKLKDVTRSTYRMLAVWLQRILGTVTTPSTKNLEQKIKRITKNKSKLRSNKAQQLKYLQTLYDPPSPIIDIVHTPSDNSRSQEENVLVFPTLGQLCANVISQNFEVTLKTKIPVVDQLDKQLKMKGEELHKLNVKISKNENKLTDLQSKIGRYSTKNVYRRDQRHEEARLKLNEAKKEIESLQLTLNNLEAAKKNAIKLKSKWKSKAVKRNLPAEACCHCSDKDNKIAKLKTTVDDLQWQRAKLMCENDDLKEQLVQTEDVNLTPKLQSVIRTKEGKQYNDNVRALWMELLSLGVSVGKVSKVVNAVITGLTDKNIECMPSKGFSSQIQTESQIVSQYQIADSISAARDSTLHLDGTKKKFREYGSFQLSLTGGDSYCLGIEEMVTGEAKTYNDTVMALFGDIAESFAEDSEEASRLTASLLATVKNTMTDRSVVNNKFVECFEEARHIIFEKHLQNYSKLTKPEQDKIVKLHTLFCGLHVLTNLGTAAAKALSKFEEISIADGSQITSYAFNKGNARSFDLIFEISQAMTRTGSQRSGCASNWEDFLASEGDRNHIESFLHHRFNVLFTDGGSVFLP